MKHSDSALAIPASTLPDRWTAGQLHWTAGQLALD